MLNLLPDRTRWQALCERPEAIPQALEEILSSAEMHPVWQNRDAEKARWEAEGLR